MNSSEMIHKSQKPETAQSKAFSKSFPEYFSQPFSKLARPVVGGTAINKAVTIAPIAQGLNLYTLQGVAVSRDGFGVPTLDGQLLLIGADGATRSLVDLARADLGIPFAIAEQNGDWIVTVSAYSPLHYLVRVKRDGTYAKIADFSKISGDFGAPFGVVVNGSEYIVTLSTDTVESTGLLLRVSAEGTIAPIATLTEFGNPFGVVMSGGDFVVAQSKGQLVRVSPIGKTSVIVDLKAAGFGIPFMIAAQNSNFYVTTNLGLVVKVDRLGKVQPIVDLLKARYGIPSGIGCSDHDLIVTTNSGYLLKIRDGVTA
ncbi:hypothetical protein [Phormidesmis priestleyi]